MLLASNVMSREDGRVNEVTVATRCSALAWAPYRGVSDMPPQVAPLFGHGSSVEPAENAHGPLIPEPATMSRSVHHAQPAPADHLCACGKIREACVHDEIRALFALISDRSPAEPLK